MSFARLGALVSTLAVLAVAGAGSASAGPATATVKVTLGKPSEFAITPSVTSVHAGRITFVVVNKGGVTHELNIIRVGGRSTVLPKGKSPGQVAEKGKLGAVEGLRSGKDGRISLTLARGSYQLFCNIPGHYQNGMRTVITVR